MARKAGAAEPKPSSPVWLQLCSGAKEKETAHGLQNRHAKFNKFKLPYAHVHVYIQIKEGR